MTIELIEALEMTVAPFAGAEKPQVSSGVAVSFIMCIQRIGKSALSEQIAIEIKNNQRLIAGDAIIAVFIDVM